MLVRLERCRHLVDVDRLGVTVGRLRCREHDAHVDPALGSVNQHLVTAAITLNLVAVAHARASPASRTMSLACSQSTNAAATCLTWCSSMNTVRLTLSLVPNDIITRPNGVVVTSTVTPSARCTIIVAPLVISAMLAHLPEGVA